MYVRTSMTLILYLYIWCSCHIACSAYHPKDSSDCQHLSGSWLFSPPGYPDWLNIRQRIRMFQGRIVGISVTTPSHCPLLNAFHTHSSITMKNSVCPCHTFLLAVGCLSLLYLFLMQKVQTMHVHGTIETLFCCFVLNFSHTLRI